MDKWKDRTDKFLDFAPVLRVNVTNGRMITRNKVFFLGALPGLELQYILKFLKKHEFRDKVKKKKDILLRDYF